MRRCRRVLRRCPHSARARRPAAARRPCANAARVLPYRVGRRLAPCRPLSCCRRRRVRICRWVGVWFRAPLDCARQLGGSVICRQDDRYVGHAAHARCSRLTLGLEVRARPPRRRSARDGRACPRRIRRDPSTPARSRIDARHRPRGARQRRDSADTRALAPRAQSGIVASQRCISTGAGLLLSIMPSDTPRQKHHRRKYRLVRLVARDVMVNHEVGHVPAARAKGKQPMVHVLVFAPEQRRAGSIERGRILSRPVRAQCGESRRCRPSGCPG